MRPRLLLLTAAGVLLLGAGVWFLPQPKGETATSLGKPAAPIAASGKTAPAAGRAMGEFGTPEFAKAAMESGAAWLEKRGRDAGSLLAMWDVTGDETLLKEAADKYPENPVVCAVMAQRLLSAKAPAEEIRKWVEGFLAATPGNPMGHYYLAVLGAREGDVAGATAALEKAVAQGGRPDSLLRDRVMAVKEGALAAGATPGEASLIALAGPMQNTGGNSQLGTMAKFIRGRFDELKNAGDTAQAQAFAELGFKAVTQLGYSKSPSLMEEMITASFRKKFLAEMDPSTLLGDTGLSAGETAREDSALKELLSRNQEIESLHTAPDAVRAAYADRFALDGEAAAMREYFAWKDRQK